MRKQPSAWIRPGILLRLEGLLVLVVACTAYSHFGQWWLFALLFLSPDIGLLGYLRPGLTWAPAFYNLLHTYVSPLILGLIAWRFDSRRAVQVALIWTAHIGFDRALGYGLKYRESFRRTHIQAAEQSTSE